MEIPIRNMVCDRCIRVVTGLFEKAGVRTKSVQLGMVVTKDEVSAAQEETLRESLAAEGFEWMDDQRVKLAAAIRQEIISLVHYGGLDEMTTNLSDYLSAKLHKEYHYLSNVFSSVEGTTIEQYFILQKIEKVKEWLVYGEKTLSEIALDLGYSSVAHLSGQFKKVTGMTTSQYKQLGNKDRKPLDKV